MSFLYPLVPASKLSEVELPDDPGVLYRVDGSSYSCTDLCIRKHKITKRTPCGVWIEWTKPHGGKPKFVNLKARKRFACPTRREALTSFIARKRRQLELLESQRKCAQKQLDTALSVETKLYDR